MLSIRRLLPGDEHVLAVLAADAPDFGLSDDGGALPALDPAEAGRYLAESSVLHWAAFEGEAVVGSLVAINLLLPVAPGAEVLLYEIGVRRSHRRRRVGTALIRRMDDWMRASGIGAVWVLADEEEAEPFYRALGFVLQPQQPRHMVRSW